MPLFTFFLVVSDVPFHEAFHTVMVLALPDFYSSF